MGKIKTYKEWSEEEKEFMEENYHLMSVENIAEELDRTKQSIWSAAKEMGLTRPIKNIKSSKYLRVKKHIENLSDKELGYVTGLIDADGTISMRIQKKGDTFYLHPYIKFTNANEHVRDTVGESIGATYTHEKHPREEMEKFGFQKKYYAVEIKGKGTLPLLKEMKPLLIEKKKRCELLIEFIESRGERHQKERYSTREKEIYWEVKKENNSISEYKRQLKGIEERHPSTIMVDRAYELLEEDK